MNTKGIRIAIIGRPNVGKSALFNRIVGRRQAIVDDAEGITRDRGYGRVEFFGTSLEMIDTGGIARDAILPFRDSVKRQAEIAMNEADAIIFVIDGRVGITRQDEEVARLLHPIDKPILVAVNKADDEGKQRENSEAATLGFENIFFVSALHGHQVTELLCAIVAMFPELPSSIEKPNTTRIAVIGKPNVGKSTLINALFRSERLVVSDIPGTTLDSVDVHVQRGEELYTFVDTAGLRRKHKEKVVADKFSRVRTEESIKRSDICILMLDSAFGLTSQEKLFLTTIERAGKSCILFFNKWDLVKEVRMEHAEKAVKDMHSFIAHCPILFGSAKYGKNTQKLFDYILELQQARCQTIHTGELNRFLERAVQKCHPPMIHAKRLRLYYITQTQTAPPKFTFFINSKELLMTSYKKYLLGQFRKAFGYPGTPVFFEFRQKKQKKLPFLSSAS